MKKNVVLSIESFPLILFIFWLSFTKNFKIFNDFDYFSEFEREWLQRSTESKSPTSKFLK